MELDSNLQIDSNIKEILKTIPKGVELIAVSKTKPLEALEVAYKTGIRDFGENKVQELVSKSEEFHEDVRWHLIGKLQTNKVKYIVDKVFLIHTLSSIKLLEKIEKEFGKKSSIANVLIQINIGREESKSGVLIEELDSLIEAIELCEFVKAKGLMVIIPKGDNDSNRDYFNKTKEIFNKLNEKQFKNISMNILSMGMSDDYEVAIEEGSNMVRIGKGIFGQRSN